jgi:ATP diphosphatase
MARLRAPDGCPWDREQTFDSIKRHTLEETYEVFDAIERRAWPDLKDELGDLLLQVLFYAQMASEAGYFTIDDVAANLNAKLIRRHPHIFGDGAGNRLRRRPAQLGADQTAEKRKPLNPGTILHARRHPRSMPAMLEAGKLGSRAAKVGFDWPNADGLFDKLQEEIGELKAELEPPQSNPVHAIEAELGDLLFTAVNLARHLKIDPESALRATNAKFRRRFAAMESAAGGTDALAASHQRSSKTMESGEERRQRAQGHERMAPTTTSASHPPPHHSEHFERCVVLQIEVWGYSDGDVIPRRVFVVAQRIGGQVSAPSTATPSSASPCLCRATATANPISTRTCSPCCRSTAMPGHRPPPQARPARRRHRPRLRSHGVDLRSAGDQERPPEHREARRHRPPLSARFLRPIFLPIAGRPSDG